MRRGPGPVFLYESLLNVRRWQVYAGRSLFAFVLLAGMTVVWLTLDRAQLRLGGPPLTFQKMAILGERFFYALAGTQVSLVLLAAPAATAGAICMDRARGTLVHMLVTDLSDAEIVLGKLGARLTPVFGMIACGVPVLALAALFGGIDFEALWGSVAVSLAIAVLGCALALAISVWATKTHEVLMAVYLLFGLWLLALPLWWSATFGGLAPPPAWFEKANPYVLVFAPYNQPGFAEPVDFAVFVGVLLVISAALAAVSVACLRFAVIKRAGRPETASPARVPVRVKRLFPTFFGPSLDRNPVLWREWHRNRPSRLAWRLWASLLGVSWCLAAWGTYELIKNGTRNGPNPLAFAFMIQLLFGFLMLSATAPTVLAEERVRGSLDVLLATPVKTRSLIIGKWWGVYRYMLMLAVLPVYGATLLAATMPGTRTFPPGAILPYPIAPLTWFDRAMAVLLCGTDFLVSGALLVSLGVAIATWVPRLGRAVALNVMVFFLIGVGWFFFAELFLRQLLLTTQNGQWIRWVISTLVSLSPIAGPLEAMDCLYDYSRFGRAQMWLASGLAITGKLAVAAGLFWLTVWTFDRCLGRMAESRRRAVAASPARWIEPIAAGATSA